MKPLFMTAAAFAMATTIAFAGAKVSPETISGVTTVDTEQAASLFDAGVTFIDVRSDSDYEAGRIPGSVHLELKSNFTEDTLGEVVKKDEKLVFYCNGHSCMRSSKASEMAAGWGYGNINYYRDGFPAWETAGNPVE